LSQAPANLARDAAHHVVCVRIVVGRFAKNVDSDASLFEFFGSSLQRALHDMPQETGIPPAVPKDRTGEDAIDLLADRNAVEFL
jgi:hypothetical protein